MRTVLRSVLLVACSSKLLSVWVSDEATSTRLPPGAFSSLRLLVLLRDASTFEAGASEGKAPEVRQRPPVRVWLRTVVLRRLSSPSISFLGSKVTLNAAHKAENYGLCFFKCHIFLQLSVKQSEKVAGSSPISGTFFFTCRW